MRSINQISKIVFTSFVSFLVFFGLISFYLKDNLYDKKCPESLNLINEKNVNLNRVAILFWLSLCQHRKVLFASSEATGKYTLPFYLRQKNFQFHQYIGAHRGIKTYAYFSGLDLNKAMAKNINALLVLNPIYFTEGPAQTSASMGYRTAITNADFNEVIGVEVTKSRSAIERLWVVTKNTFDDIQDLVLLKVGYSYDLIADDSIDKDYKPQIPTDYNLQKGVLNRFNSLTFSTDIKFEIQPTYKMFNLITQNKNSLKQCIVILPMNHRFFKSQNKKYTHQIIELYQKMIGKIKPDELIDLTDLQDENYLFMDIMHLTDYGSKIVTDRIEQSNCFKKNWLNNAN